MLTLVSALREMFGVQLYKNNARALLSRILSILNLDWLQHERSVRGVYEFKILIVFGLKTERSCNIITNYLTKECIEYKRCLKYLFISIKFPIRLKIFSEIKMI